MTRLSILIFFPILLFTLISKSTHAFQATEAQKVGLNIISSNIDEYSPSFDTVNQELFFMRRTPGRFDYTILSSKKTENGWEQPTIVSFSGTYRDDAPYISLDGNSLFFDSNRPDPRVVDESINLWKTNRTESGWSEPELLFGASFNNSNEPDTGVDEYGPAIDENGTLYFYSFRSPYRPGKRFKATRTSDYEKISTIEDIPDPSENTFVSYIGFSNDGNTAVLEGRHTGRRDTGLFYSCKNATGKWSEAKLLPLVNSTSSEGGPFLTADGAFLFFSSNRPATGTFDPGSDIYMISTADLPIPCR